MELFNINYSILAVIPAYLTALFLSRFNTMEKNRPTQHSFETIDGIRGYLAFAVFLHHSTIWHHYLESNKWETPSSNFYAHLGHDAVCLFFMITGLLFGKKLIEDVAKPIDWLRLYVGRILRLTPLYFFAVGLLFSIVVYMTNFTLNEPLNILLYKTIRWIFFAALGASANLNGLNDTGLIFAGVTWTLTYEWFFYFSLPFLSLLMSTKERQGFKVKKNKKYILLSIITVFYCFIWKPDIYYIATFAIGIFSAKLHDVGYLNGLARSKNMSAIAIIFLIISLTYSSLHSILNLLSLAIFFFIVACGNDLFGLLRQRASILLGEISYGIYLMHGIILWFVFKIIMDYDSSSLPGYAHYFNIIIAITPMLIILCFTTYEKIEKPFINSTSSLTKYVKSFASN
jgi:peptidoglycan/LPS O-acetylase OafA/YrhL